jgi:hypothetical protein
MNNKNIINLVKTISCFRQLSLRILSHLHLHSYAKKSVGWTILNSRFSLARGKLKEKVKTSPRMLIGSKSFPMREIGKSLNTKKNNYNEICF